VSGLAIAAISAVVGAPLLVFGLLVWSAGSQSEERRRRRA